MMTRMAIGVASVALAAGLAGPAAAQSRPGLALGGFYENRTDNEVSGENLTFGYYGVRLSVRDARWFEVFVDLGVQKAEWDDYESDDSGSFGVGGLLWLTRAEELMVPLDLGLYASFHSGESDMESDTRPSMDASYSRFVAQGVVRSAGFGMARPYLRAGVMQSNLDVSGLGDDGDWEATNPAVNVGVEVEATEQVTLTLEGNYSEGVGFAVRADFWF